MLAKMNGKNDLVFRPLIFRRSGLSLAGLVLVAGMSFSARSGIQAAVSSQSETNALLEIRSLTVDGSPVPFRAGEKLRLARQPRTAVFQFGSVTDSVRAPTRFRFKLDGYEENWREYPAQMRLSVRFLDSSGDQVSETDFTVEGQSEGWSSNFETAEFIRRRETVSVPPQSRSFRVRMTSAGPAATIGVYAISDLIIRSESSDDTPPVISLSKAFDAAAGTSGGDTPAGWIRDGLRPSMAKVFERASPTTTRGFVIVDDDVNGHAEWHMIKSRAVAANPGDRLLLEWDEAYSFGFSGLVSLQYLNLPAGYYRFRVEELSVWGVPSGKEISLAFEVPLAFWRTPWFWVSVLTVLLATSAGSWRYTVWRRMRLQLQRLEQQRAVESERLRIAQDIHDDLGARVTQISLLSAVAQGKESLPEAARAEFGRVSQMTRELVSALYETVWAVDPENDNLDALASYLCQMSNQLCSQSGLRCRLEVPELPPNVALSSHVRHNLIMAVKEAVHNIIKHARATGVRLRIAFETSTLSISIHDDGCGFDPAACPPGHGLGNLERRLQAIGGSYAIESRLGAGTTVSLRLPVAAAAAGSV
jgi:signal transduction histidine kinase